MITRFLSWLRSIFSPRQEPKRTDLKQTGAHLRQTGRHRKPLSRSRTNQESPKHQPEFVDIDPAMKAEIENNGPGKNVLLRKKYVREDTGTHDTLKIVDDSLIETGEEAGIDPYNTGQFDRSKNWDSRFRK
jgi:hypothetical protein